MARPKKQAVEEKKFKSPQELMELSKRTEGWLTDEESAGLWNVAQMAYQPSGNRWVEVGSYCGKSTVLLGGTLANPPLNVAGTHEDILYAVDPHLGHLTSFSGWDENHMLISEGHVQNEPTYEKLCATLKEAGLESIVSVQRMKSTEFVPPDVIDLLFIDGLHDYNSVKADWNHYKQILADGAVVCFHDYGDWADPTRVVDEAVALGELYISSRHGSLVVCKFLGVK